jgi:hypothetical protein
MNTPDRAINIQKSKGPKKDLRFYGLVLLSLSLVVMAYSLYVANSRVMTGLENLLLQFLLFIISIAGSYLLGADASKNLARDGVKAHARSAFRRLVTLYRGLAQIGSAIEKARGSITNQQALAKLETLEAMVAIQLGTTGDALDDWQDMVPEDVEELRIRLNQAMGEA